jgi:glycosyl hydrolase family 39 (putative alpha-L-iduronidase)
MRTSMRIIRYCLLASLFIMALALTTLPAREIHLRPTASPIPPQFFGMHFHRLDSTTSWPKDIDIHTWRLLGTYIMWPNLEPQKGQWNFTVLNKLLDLAEEHHVDVLMPLVLSPPWASSRPTEHSSYSPGNAAEPKDLEDWRNYIRTVATRYKGRIHEYEIWNEPNLKDFYTGSIPQLVEMARVAYTTLKEIDPTNLVSSPPVTAMYGVTWLDQYLQAGGGKYADVIGYHFYVNPAPPEEMVAFIQRVKEVMVKNGVGNKPLWNTESGWAIQNAQSVVKPAPGKGYNSVVFPPDVAAAYLARAYILSWASGVSRFYWYSWDNFDMGLVDHDGKTLKSPAIAYGEIQKWLIGARMDSCAADTAETWTCTISRDGGYHGWIVWNPDGRRTFKLSVPSQWNVVRIRDLLGHMSSLAPGASVEVSIMPHLLEAPGH